MSRPTTKRGGRKLELYLSEATRQKLQDQATARGVSRSQIVEDLVLRPGKILSPQNSADIADIASASDSIPMLKVAEDTAHYTAPKKKPQRSSRAQRSARLER